MVPRPREICEEAEDNVHLKKTEKNYKKKIKDDMDKSCGKRNNWMNEVFILVYYFTLFHHITQPGASGIHLGQDRKCW